MLRVHQVRRQHGMWVRNSLLEVVGILRPRLLLLQSLLLCGVIFVVRITLNVLDVIFQLPTLLGTCLVRHARPSRSCHCIGPVTPYYIQVLLEIRNIERSCLAAHFATYTPQINLGSRQLSASGTQR